MTIRHCQAMMDACQNRLIAIASVAMLSSLGCRDEPITKHVQPDPAKPDRALAVTDDGPAMEALRDAMVDQQLSARDIDNEAVLAAMRKVPRHRFVPPEMADRAYQDRPLPIGSGQTISQPYIVALMTQLTEPTPQSKALDVGTGSGYQAAVLAELVDAVYSIEIVDRLAAAAKQRLDELGYENIDVRHGDGYQGWPEQAPFDLIIVAAAPERVPQPLIDQLAPGGKLVIPVGARFEQQLLLIHKHHDGRIQRRVIAPVSFVPMTGAAME